MGMEDAVPDMPPALDALVRSLAARPRVNRVILFGSRARGDHGPRSDYDLAVDGDPAERHEVSHLVEVAPTLAAIDLVWLPDADEAIRDEIAREGVTLFERAPWPQGS